MDKDPSKSGSESGFKFKSLSQIRPSLVDTNVGGPLFFDKACRKLSHSKSKKKAMKTVMDL